MTQVLSNAEVSATRAAADAHKGGRLYAWHRSMSRNSYLVDSIPPTPDAMDKEKDRLWLIAEAAQERFQTQHLRYIAQESL